LISPFKFMARNVQNFFFAFGGNFKAIFKIKATYILSFAVNFSLLISIFSKTPKSTTISSFVYLVSFCYIFRVLKTVLRPLKKHTFKKKSLTYVNALYWTSLATKRYLIFWRGLLTFFAVAFAWKEEEEEEVLSDSHTNILFIHFNILAFLLFYTLYEYWHF